MGDVIFIRCASGRLWQTDVLSLNFESDIMTSSEIECLLTVAFLMDFVVIVNNIRNIVYGFLF